MKPESHLSESDTRFDPGRNRTVFLDLLKITTVPSYSGSTPSACIVEKMVGKRR